MDVAGARHVAGTYAGAWLGLLATEARGGTGIHHLRRTALQGTSDIAGIGHGAMVQSRREMAPVAAGTVAILGGTAGGEPGRKAALQDLYVAHAEGAQHPPDPGGGEQTHPVIDDDVHAVADAELAHARGEDLRAGQHVRQRRRLVTHGIDIEADRAGYVRGLVLGFGVPALGGEIP